MQAQKEAPPDMQCKDKFLLQSVVASNGVTAKDIEPEWVGCYSYYGFCFLFVQFIYFWFMTYKLDL